MSKVIRVHTYKGDPPEPICDEAPGPQAEEEGDVLLFCHKCFAIFRKELREQPALRRAGDS